MTWLKNWWKRLFLLVLAILVFGNYRRLNILEKNMKLEATALESYSPSIIPNFAILDFTNKSGAARVSSSFSEVLVSSKGSIKKGEGYEVYLMTINPSSIYLTGTTNIYTWSHNGTSQATTVTNPNITLFPGSSISETAFLSPVQGDELKTISVQTDFNLMRPTKY